MVYLKEFQIPSDLWVAWYFTPWRDDISPLPEDMPEEIACLHPEKFSYHNTWYPWTIFENRFLPPDLVSLSGVLCPRLKFSDITIFYGGNGSGKSTLLNVIAEKLHSDRCVLHNTSPFFNDYVKACMAFLNTSILLEEDGVPRSQIITSDEVFKQLQQQETAIIRYILLGGILGKNSMKDGILICHVILTRMIENRYRSTEI